MIPTVPFNGPKSVYISTLHRCHHALPKNSAQAVRMMRLQARQEMICECNPASYRSTWKPPKSVVISKRLNGLLDEMSASKTPCLEARR